MSYSFVATANGHDTHVFSLIDSQLVQRDA